MAIKSTVFTPALAVYRQAREAALAAFSRHHRIEPLWHVLTSATDALLASVARDPSLTLVAVGGYGRRELFPYSDVDVLVLVEGDVASDATVAPLLQQLWDMQIAVSHATRTLDESIASAQGDPTIASSLMDARYIAGDRKAYRQLKKRFQQEVLGKDPGGFIAAKLAERDKRHAKSGDSRFMLEPNIKEGKGGLRDLQTLTWLARYCYSVQKAAHLVRTDLLTAAEWRHYRQAYLFLSTVRAQMHLIRGRADERLTFDLQTEIAGRLHFRGHTAQEKAERFMRRYFQFARYVGSLTRVFCALLEEENLRLPPAPFSQKSAALAVPDGFALDAGRLTFAVPESLGGEPALAVSLFVHAAALGLDIHPRAYLAIARVLPVIGRRLMFEGTANACFMTLLLTAKTPDVHLRRMNECGILGALIPEFGRITGMMQYDGYHTYTVDEHILVAVGNLAQIEQGAMVIDLPLSTQVAHEITGRAPLYLAMLCHDIAKGTGGAHARKGEALAERIAQRMGLSAHEGALAGWLVKHQELITETAFKRDLDDAQTIADFVAIVQSPERLRLLLLLTVSDVKAVGPTIWNRWKGSLMRRLYNSAMEAMGVAEGAICLLPNMPLTQLPSPAREAHRLWSAAPQTPALVITHDRFREISEVVCCAAYAPNFLRMLAGVLAYIGASIVTARSVVIDGNAALTTLAIQDVQAHSFADEHYRLEQLGALLAQAQRGAIDFACELPKRRLLSSGREVAIPTAVFIDNQVSGAATVVEVNARDRLGLLYDILGAFEECQLQVVSAQLATYGIKAVDVFYVKDAYGIKIAHPAKLAHLQRVLLDRGNGLALDYTI